MTTNTVNYPLAYKLGFNAGSYTVESINYRAKMVIPFNSFSNPDIQIKQYIEGWNAARKGVRK